MGGGRSQTGPNVIAKPNSNLERFILARFGRSSRLRSSTTSVEETVDEMGR